MKCAISSFDRIFSGVYVEGSLAKNLIHVVLCCEPNFSKINKIRSFDIKSFLEQICEGFIKPN